MCAIPTFEFTVEMLTSKALTTTIGVTATATVELMIAKALSTYIIDTEATEEVAATPYGGPAFVVGGPRKVRG